MTSPGSAAVRPAAVAGLFYPAEPRELRAQLQRLLADNPSRGSAPKALIAPHAGYIYSGPVAARAYNLLAPVAARIRRVLLLGPAHRVPLRGLALPHSTAFRTPLGDVPLDTDAMAELDALPGVQRSDEAHRQDHSLVVGWSEAGQMARVLERLWGGDETLVVVSSDLSHYHAYAEAHRLDEETARHIESQASTLEGEQACGAYPLNGLLAFARMRRLQVSRLDLRNSGDTAGGRDRVVGYGAWSLHAA